MENKNFTVLFYGEGSTVRDRVQLPKSYKDTTRRQFTFYHKSPGIPGTQFIDLGRMKDEVDLGATQSFGTPGLGIKCPNH